MEPEEPDASAREILRAGLTELGLPDTEAPRLGQLADLLAQWAARLNLTAHRSVESIAKRLILDAIALAQVLPDAPILSLADLGSGAGFPGLPIAILWPECRVTLVEARERRHHFQRTVIRALALRNTDALHGRAETLPAEPHQIVVAQAAAAPSIALSWMRRWVAPTGRLILPQSESPDPFEVPAGVLHVRTVPYWVPIGGTARTAWIGRLAHGSTLEPADDLPQSAPL